MIQLSPPIIDIQIPAFYDEYLPIPYRLGNNVSFNNIKGFSLQIRQINTNKIIGLVETENFNGSQAFFNLPREIYGQLKVGKYYKVQIAYISKSENAVGLYSSVSTIKFTSYPTVEISNLDQVDTNLNYNIFIGRYYNKDQQEKVTEYRFNIYDENGSFYYTTGWLIHDTTADVDINTSLDQLYLSNKLKENTNYYIEYEIKTNNLLQVSSLKYGILEFNLINSDLKCDIELENDEENGCINIYISDMEKPIVGNFLLLRAESKNNYANWTPLYRFNIQNEKYSYKKIYSDLLIESGETYIYAIQQFNKYNIYSNKIKSEMIKAYFEHIYLCDKDGRQLKMKFNPKITSFKTNQQESRFETLGSRYPKFYSNPKIDYKSFNINGLVSYLSDELNMFDNSYDADNITTNLTKENIETERHFRNRCERFLTDKSVKYFKSPTEGSFLIRLQNFSMEPEVSLGRMLYNIAINGFEVDEINGENLIKYGFINKDIDTSEVITKSYFHEAIELKDKSLNTNILGEREVYNLAIKDAPFGSEFLINGNLKIKIGLSGYYSLPRDYKVNNFQILSLDYKTKIGQTIPILEYGYIKEILGEYDQIQEIKMKTILGDYYVGKTDILSKYNIGNDNLSFIFYLKVQAREIIEVESLEQDNPNYLYKYKNKIYDYQKNIVSNIKYTLTIDDNIIDLSNYGNQIFYMKGFTADKKLSIENGLIAEIGVRVVQVIKSAV